MDCGGRRFLRQRTVLLLRKLSIEMWTSAQGSDIRSAGYYCHMWWTNISVDMVARVLSVRTYVCPYLCLARMTAQWAPIASRSTCLRSFRLTKILVLVIETNLNRACRCRRILRMGKWGREKGMREESDIEMLTILLKLKKSCNVTSGGKWTIFLRDWNHGGTRGVSAGGGEGFPAGIFLRRLLQHNLNWENIFVLPIIFFFILWIWYLTVILLCLWFDNLCTAIC